MIDDVRDLSRAEKEKAIARKDISGYIGKCFVTAIVAVFAMTLFALYMIGNFMDAFTAKNALATTAIFIASGVLTVFLMAGIYRFTHQKGTSVRDFHLTIILVVVTFMASIATATKFNLYAMPIALATLVLIELIDRRSATLSTGRGCDYDCGCVHARRRDLRLYHRDCVRRLQQFVRDNRQFL